VGSREEARLRGRLRAARHSLWDEIGRENAERITRVARRSLTCSVCGQPIDVGRKVTTWTWDDDGVRQKQHAHPDCLGVMDDLDRDHWWVMDTLAEAIGDMPWTELVELVRGCADPDCAALFRQLGEWARADGDDDE
jgi:hypothetical protein